MLQPQTVQVLPATQSSVPVQLMWKDSPCRLATHSEVCTWDLLTIRPREIREGDLLANLPVSPVDMPDQLVLLGDKTAIDAQEVAPRNRVGYKSAMSRTKL